MQIFDVFTKRFYEKEGEKKVISYKAGVMKITDRGNIYLRLFHIPDTEFYVREREPNMPIVDIDKE
jgi:hypothetical protein